MFVYFQRDEFFKFFDSPFSESTSSAKPKELIIKKIVESSNRSDFEQNSERIEPVNLIDNEVTNFPSHSSLVAVMQQIPMNSTKKISKTAKKLYVVENTDIISYPTNPQTNSVTVSPTFLRKPCDVLSCTFMEENCTGYINGTGWLIYNGTKSNSSVLDNLLMENNNGWFHFNNDFYNDICKSAVIGSFHFPIYFFDFLSRGFVFVYHWSNRNVKIVDSFIYFSFQFPFNPIL